MIASKPASQPTSELADEVCQRLDELERDVNSLTEQVAQDFEELMLLQSLTRLLTIHTSSAEPLKLIEQAVQMLPMPLQATAILFIPDRMAFNELEIANAGEPIWNGEALLSAAECEELRDAFLARGNKPWIRNKGIVSIRGQIEQMVMVEVLHERRRFGWLAACNHRPAPERQHEWSQKGFSTIEASLMQTASSMLSSQLHHLRLLRLQETMFTDVVRAMVGALEARDRYTCGHSERVAMFARKLSAAAGMSLEVCDRLYLTGLLHDIGKIAIPDAVLQKPGHLENDERALMETHTDAGWRILHPLSQLRDVLPGVLFHHEKFDGTGYPDKLQGKDIPEDARVLAICDAYDAMTSDRPYRQGMPQEKAEAILRQGAGSHWDPDLIEVFLQIMPDIISIRQSYQPREISSRD
jgi:HD-GYP domain-containing protein (c-di-GMP phosphodiesterase class II)